MESHNELATMNSPMKRGALRQYTSWHRPERSEIPRSYAIATTPRGFNGCVWEHGLLDKWKEQLPHDDVKQPQHNCQLCLLSWLLSVLPLPLLSLYFVYFPWRRKWLPMSVRQLTSLPSQISINIPSYQHAPGVLHQNRDWDCVGGMDMDQIHTDASIEILKFKSLAWWSCRTQIRTHLILILLDVPIVNKIIRKFHKAVLNQQWAWAIRVVKPCWWSRWLNIFPRRLQLWTLLQ